MNSPGTKALIAEVEETTGFKVVVDTIDDIMEDAQMISARPELPVHTIRVNKAKLATADYIVAIQCAMLVRLWSHPQRIPVFSPIKDKVLYQVSKVASSKPLAGLAPKFAQQTANQIVQGLLHQLRSQPIEILSIRDCYTHCPDLHELQSDAINAQLQTLSKNFAPDARSIAPDSIWRATVSMSAAYALNWSELTASPLAMLLYQSAGFSEIAKKLLGEVQARQGKDSGGYIQTVDAWAEQLSLRQLYTWEFRNGCQ